MASPPLVESPQPHPGCVFCRIVAGTEHAYVVLDDQATLAFLDHRPLARGHTLLIPKAHHPTITDLPDVDIQGLFSNAQRLCTAVQAAFEAEGSLMAVNNNVSQSVPHLHIHVVPRRRGDKYKGNLFFPRIRDLSEEDLSSAQKALQNELGLSAS